MYRLRAEKGRGERKQWSPIVVPEMENGNWRKRNETKQKKKRKKKEKKKKKTLHVIAGVCCVTAALYFVDEECVRTNLQPLLMAKWLVTDRW